MMRKCSKCEEAASFLAPSLAERKKVDANRRSLAFDFSFSLCRYLIFVFSLLVFSLCTFFPAPLRAASDTAALDALRRIPVQHNGRIKPFQSFAQEAVLYVTAKTRFAGREPTELVWQWIAQPEKWKGQPLIPVTYPPLRKEFKLMLIDSRLPPEVVLQHTPFTEKLRAIYAKRTKREKLTPAEQKQLELYQKASFWRDLAEGNTPGFIAHPNDPEASWLPLRGLAGETYEQLVAQFYPPDALSEVRLSLHLLMTGLRSGAALSELAEPAASFRAALDNLFRAGGVILDTHLLNTEIHYLNLQPFRWAWILYFTSLFLSLLGTGIPFSRAWFSSSRAEGENRTKAFSPFTTWLRRTGYGFFLAGFGLHAYGFYLRCVIAGRPPVTNMYESLIWVSWAVVLFSIVLFIFYRAEVILNTAAIVAGVALLLAQSFPVALNPAISPLVPVLRSNFWLTVHVLTITLAYGAFLLAWGLAHVVIFSCAADPSREGRHKSLAQFLYRALQMGVILLAGGTVLGGVWANYSWGRFWGWDPKETWALIALLGYITVLHGRFTGWLGTFGLAVGSVVAFLGVLMAWYGVNFVLATGLHSYGFGGGGLPYILAAVLFDLALIVAAIYIYKTREKNFLSKVK